MTLTLSLPIPLRLYTLPYWSNPPFFIFDIRALWRSVLSARAPECQKLKMVGSTSMTPNLSEQFRPAGVERVKLSHQHCRNLANQNNRHKSARTSTLSRGYMWNEMILKLFQCVISHVTTSETEIKLFQPLTLFQNYFSDTEHVGKYSWAAISFWNNFEIISGKFSCAEIKLFQSDVDEGWNNFEII